MNENGPSPVYKALPYLKPIAIEEAEDEQGYALSPEDDIVELPWNEGFIVTFLCDDEGMDVYRYVQNRDLRELGLTPEQLLAQSLDHLYDRTESHELQLQELQDAAYTMLLMDGSFEASLLLLDDLWDGTLNDYAPSGYAVAFPARDVLMFSDIRSEEGIAQMRAVIERIWVNGDHLLSKAIWTRNAGKWVRLDA
ncbi:DUF1444 domain-containing protein [Paenibacillus xanthanilyticus]|uniref:DUF1444 domain-containing protein n=1 Tax=Paenibacillus xanthanilyticus TaxID=1783531 RepID=A0ABV8KDV4_9BACL